MGPLVPWVGVTLLVQKYGGTSVGDPDRIRAVADHIVRTRREGNDVVVVVSAMGKTTDELIGLARQVSSDPDDREMALDKTARHNETGEPWQRITLRPLGKVMPQPVDCVSQLGSTSNHNITCAWQSSDVDGQPSNKQGTMSLHRITELFDCKRPRRIRCFLKHIEQP